MTGEATYRAAYVAAVENADRLAPELSARMSAPQPLVLYPSYVDSPTKVMIMGQETAGLNRSIFARGPSETYDSEVASTRAFDMAEGQQQWSSPFWRAFREVCHLFDVDVPKGAAWSNVVKVQHLCDGKSASFRNFKKDERYLLLQWQKELFDAELAYAAPRKVLLFTGPWYEHATDFLLEGLEWKSVHDLDPRELAVAKCGVRGIDFVRTYHPRYLQQTWRWPLIEAACRYLQQSA